MLKLVNLEYMGSLMYLSITVFWLCLCVWYEASRVSSLLARAKPKGKEGGSIGMVGLSWMVGSVGLGVFSQEQQRAAAKEGS